MYTIEPIGYFHCAEQSLYDLPRQGVLSPGNKGEIQLLEGMGFETALEGLHEFDLIWVIFCFHRCQKWKPKVLPPRGEKKQGVFATRSPHRPNFIGFSCVKLNSVNGLNLKISNHDLLDGTPILDLKPYLNYADSRKSDRQGWLERLPEEAQWTMEWSSLAIEQMNYLSREWGISLRPSIELRLLQNPLPYPNHRIKQLSEGEYQLAIKTWRVTYSIEGERIIINGLHSGHDNETLTGKKQSKWEDVSIHQAFVSYFFK